MWTTPAKVSFTEQPPYTRVGKDRIPLDDSSLPTQFADSQGNGVNPYLNRTLPFMGRDAACPRRSCAAQISSIQESHATLVSLKC